MPSQNTARGPPAAAIRWRVGIIGESACWRLCRRRHNRHTFASQWMMNGGDLYALSGILGHKSKAMTQRYAHHSPDVRFAEQLDAILRPNAPKKGNGSGAESPKPLYLENGCGGWI